MVTTVTPSSLLPVMSPISPGQRRRQTEVTTMTRSTAALALALALVSCATGAAEAQQKQMQGQQHSIYFEQSYFHCVGNKGKPSDL